MPCDGKAVLSFLFKKNKKRGQIKLYKAFESYCQSHSTDNNNYHSYRCRSRGSYLGSRSWELISQKNKEINKAYIKITASGGTAASIIPKRKVFRVTRNLRKKCEQKPNLGFKVNTKRKHKELPHFEKLDSPMCYKKKKEKQTIQKKKKKKDWIFCLVIPSPHVWEETRKPITCTEASLSLRRSPVPASVRQMWSNQSEKISVWI